MPTEARNCLERISRRSHPRARGGPTNRNIADGDGLRLLGVFRGRPGACRVLLARCKPLADSCSGGVAAPGTFSMKSSTLATIEFLLLAQLLDPMRHIILIRGKLVEELHTVAGQDPAQASHEGGRLRITSQKDRRDAGNAAGNSARGERIEDESQQDGDGRRQDHRFGTARQATTTTTRMKEITFRRNSACALRRAAHHGSSRQPRMNPTAKHVRATLSGRCRVYSQTYGPVSSTGCGSPWPRHRGPFLTAGLLHPLRFQPGETVCVVGSYPALHQP